MLIAYRNEDINKMMTDTAAVKEKEALVSNVLQQEKKKEYKQKIEK